MKNRQGFTLAEVLITLGIIGVVAAMTIPTLMTSTGSAEYRTGFKKIISTLNQAVTMSMALDSTDFGGTSATGTGTADNSIYGILSSRMNVLRGLEDGKAFDAGPSGTVDTDMVTMFGATYAAASNYTLFLQDGMVISWPKTSSGCSAAAGGCDAIVDVNGSKGPNRLTSCNTNAVAVNDGANAKTEKSTGTPVICGTTGAAANADEPGLNIADQFSIKLIDQQVLPNGEGARAVLFR